MQRRSSRGQKGAGRKAKGMRAGAGGKRRGTCKRTVTNRLKASYSSSKKRRRRERASRGRGTVCRSVIISVHTSRAESLTKNLSRSAPRLTGRPRVEALVACGAHQIQTQGKCTREVGGRESDRGRESACRCPCRVEGAHAQFSCKKVAALNHAPSVAT